MIVSEHCKNVKSRKISFTIDLVNVVRILGANMSVNRILDPVRDASNILLLWLIYLLRLKHMLRLSLLNFLLQDELLPPTFSWQR
jgi:hypothetical protein